MDFELLNDEELFLKLFDYKTEEDSNYLNKKTSLNRNSNNRYVSIPWRFFEEFDEFGGIDSFIVLMYFLYYRNTMFEVKTNLKIICEWAKISRNMLENSKKLIFFLSEIIEIPRELYDAKLTTTLNFKIKILKSPFFKVNFNYFVLLKEKGGSEMFTIVCYLLNLTENKDRLTEYTNNYHQALISQEQLGKRLLMSPNTVSKYLKQLEDLKYISSYRKFNVEKGMYDCTQYTVINKNGKKFYRRNWKNK